MLSVEHPSPNRVEIHWPYILLFRGAKNKPYLTNPQLVAFLNNRQRDPRLNEIIYPYYNETMSQNIINTYEPNKDFSQKGEFVVFYVY